MASAGSILGLLLAGFQAASAGAADAPVMIAGTWKWEQILPSGEAIESTVKLQQSGATLSGVLIARGTETRISEGAVEGDRVRFSVVRERNNRKQVAEYDGRFDGKTIKGTSRSDFGGESRTRDWEALREADFAARPPNLSGVWKYLFPGHSGQSFEPSLKIEHTAQGIQGVLRFNEHEAPITEARLEGRDLWIRIVRDRDGQSLTSIYKGKVEGNRIQGTIEADWAGVKHSYPWDARRQGR